MQLFRRPLEALGPYAEADDGTGEGSDNAA